jgi:hypothetical protein
MDTIKFKCDKCGFEKNIPSQYSGKRVRCPKCHAENRVGQAVEQKQSVEQKAAPAKAVTKFNCPGCGQKMGVAAENAGKKVRCPKCKAVVTVPGPAQAGAPAKAPKAMGQVELEEPQNDELRLSTPEMDDLLSLEKQAQSVARLSGKPVAKSPVEEEDARAELMRLQAKAGGRSERQEEPNGKSVAAVMVVYPIGAICSLVIIVGLVMFFAISPRQTSFAAAERYMSDFMKGGRGEESDEAETTRAAATEPNAPDANTVSSGTAEPASGESEVGKPDKSESTSSESEGEKSENTTPDEGTSAIVQAPSTTNDERQDDTMATVRPGGETRGSIASRPGTVAGRTLRNRARMLEEGVRADPYGPELTNAMADEQRSLAEYMNSHEYKDMSQGAMERMSPYSTGVNQVLSLVYTEPSLVLVKKSQCYLPDTKGFGFALTYMPTRSADKAQMAVFILETRGDGLMIQGLRAKRTILGWSGAVPGRAADIEERANSMEIVRKFRAIPGWYWYMGLPGGAVGIIILLGSLWVLYEKTGRMGSSSLVPVYNLWVLAEVGSRPGWLSLLVTAAVVPLMLGGAMLYGAMAACMAIMLLISLGVAKEFDRGPLFALGLWLLPCAFYPMLVAKIEG